MGNAVEHESIGGLLESYAFIEAFGIFLCLNIYLFGIEVLLRCLNGMEHDLLTIAFAPFGCDNSTY